MVITSNSEKNLPAPFLRRCVYYHIPKPDKARFAEILNARLKVDATLPLISDALDFLMYLRGTEADLNKKPRRRSCSIGCCYYRRTAQNPTRVSATCGPSSPRARRLIKDEGRDGKELLKNFFDVKT